MTKRKIYITEHDMNRLQESFHITSTMTEKDKQYYERLQEKLDWAEVVEPKDIPENIVTMNSMILLKDLDTGEEKIFNLVFPDKAKVSPMALSILAPIGTALLGHKEGDTIIWDVPGGTKRYLILEVVYQPERLGNYEL